MGWGKALFDKCHVRLLTKERKREREREREEKTTSCKKSLVIFYGFETCLVAVLSVGLRLSPVSGISHIFSLTNLHLVMSEQASRFER